MAIRVVLADDHPLILDGLERLLGTVPDFEIVARCTDGRAALEAIEAQRPDVLILDLGMPKLSGHELLRLLGERELPTRVIVLTASVDQDEIASVVRRGARGVILKETAPRSLIQAIRRVHAGERWLERRTMERAIDELLHREAGAREAAGRLTPTELKVVRLLGEGLRNRQIAGRLGIEEGTVKVHLHNLYHKLGVEGRLALVCLAQRRGWI